MWWSYGQGKHVTIYFCWFFSFSFSFLSIIEQWNSIDKTLLYNIFFDFQMKLKKINLNFLRSKLVDAIEQTSNWTWWIETSGNWKLGMWKTFLRWCSIKIGDTMDGSKYVRFTSINLLHGRTWEIGKSKSNNRLKLIFSN